MVNAPAADITTSPELVEALLCAQLPAVADLPIRAYAHGWDNDLYRVGDSMLVRLPRRESAVPLLRNEMRWLPYLGRLVDLPLPQPILNGEPTEQYPYPWTVVPWAEGIPANEIPVADRVSFAEDLADLLWALHVPAHHEAPINPFRGGSLNIADADARTRERLAGRPDAEALLDRWAAWSTAPDWDGVDTWIHGDLHPFNMIVGADGRLASVIDWGDLSAGDPAADLATAWLTFDEAGRRAFRERVDQGQPQCHDTWTRAKAWALHLGLVFATRADDQPWLAAIGEHALSQLAGEPA